MTQEQLKAEIDSLLDDFGHDAVNGANRRRNIIKYRKNILTAFNNHVDRCAPEKRTLIEPVTGRVVANNNDTVMIDLDRDKKGSLRFVQNNGYNVAIDEFTANLKGATDEN